MSKAIFTRAFQLLWRFLLVAALSSAIVFLCHHYYLRPHEMIVVDFRALSEDKLAQMVDDARTGHPVTPAALKGFIRCVHQIVAEEANGRPVYLAGAIFNPKTDITLRVAEGACTQASSHALIISPPEKWEEVLEANS